MKSPEETIEQRQQRSNRYKDLLIISAPVKDDTDESSSVLCLITLPEDDQTVDTNMSLVSRQLTIRIDVEGKILSVDATQLKAPVHPVQFAQYATFLTKEVGHDMLQLVHLQDRQKIMHYLQHVMKQGTPENQSVRYRLLVAPEHYVHTEVHSRFFRSETGEQDFIMLCHQILDSEIMGGSGMEGGPSFSGLLPNINHSMTSQNMLVKHSSGLGGPLLGSSIINGGGLSQISPRNSQLMNEGSLIQPPPFNETFFQSEPFDFESFASPPFDIDNQFNDSRPESRTSMASVSTPRPSSATAAFSPITAPLCASPLTPYSQPSPASITNNNNTTMTNNNLTPSSNAASASNNNNNNTSSGFNSAGSQGSSFQFSFEDNKEKVQEQLQKMQQQQQENNTSERLRNLLMKSPSSVDEEQLRKNQILKVTNQD